MKKGRKREMGRFRNLPKLILVGEKMMFGVYRDGMKARFRMEGSNHVGLMRKIMGFFSRPVRDFFFHIGRVNGTIEEERILWREGQRHQKRRKIFLHRERGKRSGKRRKLGQGCLPSLVAREGQIEKRGRRRKEKQGVRSGERRTI